VARPVRLSRSLEDYLEAVAVLVSRHGVARTRDVASRMGVAPPSAHSALRKLADKGLVRHQPYQFIELTDQGEQVGGAIRRRHELLRSFLVEVLDVPDEEAMADACRLEHAVSPTTVARIVALMDIVKGTPGDRPDWLRRFQAWRRQHRSGSHRSADDRARHRRPTP